MRSPYRDRPKPAGEAGRGTVNRQRFDDVRGGMTESRWHSPARLSADRHRYAPWSSRVEFDCIRFDDGSGVLQRSRIAGCVPFPDAARLMLDSPHPPKPNRSSRGGQREQGRARRTSRPRPPRPERPPSGWLAPCSPPSPTRSLGANSSLCGVRDVRRPRPRGASGTHSPPWTEHRHRCLDRTFAQDRQDPSRPRQVAAEVRVIFVATVGCKPERPHAPKSLMSGIGPVVTLVAKEVSGTSAIRHSCEHMRSRTRRLNYLARGVLNLTGCEFSPPIVLRPDAPQWKRTRPLSAYGYRTSSPSRATSLDRPSRFHVPPATSCHKLRVTLE